jgi:hypothetical protein
MSESRKEPSSLGQEISQDPWTFEGNRLLQLRQGLAMTPAERLRWLEDTVEELLPWVGRAAQGRPVDSSS